jgi:hypothetical protein
MDSTLWLAVINSFFVLMGIIVTGTIAYFTAKLNIKADKIVKVNKDIHTLVNSSMGSQLKIGMLLSERIAKMTNDQADIKFADEAKALYDAHIQQQAIVDKEIKDDQPH